jgi:pimeloyl-ACP methyl ester carboxylesterase
MLPSGRPGENWILLRGLVREQGHWHDFADQFRKARPQADLELLDTPGNGDRRAEKSPLSIGAYTDSLRAHSRFISEGKKVYLLAMSMGAMIAVDWITRFPEDFHRVVLLSTSFSSLSPFFHRLRPEAWPVIFGAPLRGNIRDRETRILRLELNLRRDFDELVRRNTELAETRPPQVSNAVRQLLACARFRGVPRKPAVPVVLLAGLGDRLMHPDCSMKLARKWGIPIQTHPTAGHDLAVDDGAWVIHKLNLFIDSKS